MNVIHRVRALVVELGWPGAPEALDEEFPLIESGAVDSMAILEILLLLERDFGIQVLDEEVVPDNFGSLGAIDRFVASKRGEG